MKTIDVHTPAGYALAAHPAPAQDQDSTYLRAMIHNIAEMSRERGIDITQHYGRPRNTRQATLILQWLRKQPVKYEASTATPAPAPQAPVLQVEKYAYFAVPEGELGYSKPHFFRVKAGRKAGYLFLDEQASDDMFPVKGARKAEIMAWLALNEQAARELYGTLISRCSRCNRTLTDHNNPYFPAYGPECGGK